MKIFFYEASGDGTVGGSHTCMYNLLRNMHGAAFRFTAAFYSDNPYARKFQDLGIDVNIVPVARPTRQGNVLLRKIRNWYKTEYLLETYLDRYFYKERFDLVVINNSIFTAFPYIHVCARLRIPILVYERGIGRDFEKRHITASAHIQAAVPVSNAVRENLARQGYQAPIIERIYDGIDPATAITRRRPANIKAELGIPEKSRVIGIIGNIRQWKGQMYFIEAFQILARRYNDLYGMIVGGCAEEDSEFEAVLKDIVRKAGLRDRLLFLGYRKDVPELLSVFDVFIHASTKPEPFGMVILEAMAARKPVVASNLGGPVEILNKGECGILVPPKDGKAIALACDKYFCDSAFRNTIVNKAYERQVTNFHISRTVEQTTALFKRVSAATGKYPM